MDFLIFSKIDFLKFFCTKRINMKNLDCFEVVLGAEKLYYCVFALHVVRVWGLQRPKILNLVLLEGFTLCCPSSRSYCESVGVNDSE